MRANASSYQQAGHLDLGSSETKLLPLSAVALSPGSQDLLIPVRPCFLASPEFFAVIDMTGFHWLWKGEVGEAHADFPSGDLKDRLERVPDL